MATGNNEADNARESASAAGENTKTGNQKQDASAEFDKLQQDAEQDAPRTRKPGSSNGANSEQNNNGRGGGK